MFNFSRRLQSAIQPMCKRALELDASEREAWLEELRADCPTVARELERLLQPMLQQPLESHSAFGTTRATSMVAPGSPEHLGLRY